MKKRLTLFAVLAAILSSSTIIKINTTPTTQTYTVYLPLVLAPAINTSKCSAAYDPLLNYAGIGINCAYEWGHSFINAQPIQVYNDVRSKPNIPMQGYVMDCSLATYIDCLKAAAVRTTDWLIWNEPDWTDPSTSDNLTPTQAAQYYRVISDTIKAVNPNSRFIVGNILFSFGTWREDFIKEYQRLYNQDVRQSIYAWGIHDYASIGSNCPMPYTDTCLLNNFTKQLDAHITWLQANDPNKPLWLTEFNWSPFNETDKTSTARLVPQMCAAIRARPQIAKYFYFVGSTWSGSINMSLFNLDGTESIIGTAYESC